MTTRLYERQPERTTLAPLTLTYPLEPRPGKRRITHITAPEYEERTADTANGVL